MAKCFSEWFNIKQKTLPSSHYLVYRWNTQISPDLLGQTKANSHFRSWAFIQHSGLGCWRITELLGMLLNRLEIHS